MDAVQRDLNVILTQDQIDNGGLFVYTTLDPAVQNAAQQALETQLSKIEHQSNFRHPIKANYQAPESGEDSSMPYLEGAVVAIDNASQRWRSIQSTFGVSRLVTNGDDPATVPEGVVHALKAREDDKGFIQLDSKPAFTPGDKVRVLAGAFMDSAGLFNGLADHDRVSILLDMLGRKVRVLLDADMVAAA